MKFHQLFDNGETQSQSSNCTFRRCIGLSEPVKHKRKEFGTYASSTIGNAEFQLRFGSHQGNLNSPSVLRKFDRVGYDIPRYLLKALRISRYEVRLQFERPG